MSVQTKEKILKAAEKEFSEKGFHGTQISHIIRSAGVARGTFYIYFKSKEEIFEEILKRVIEDLKERIKPIDLSKDPVQQVKENIKRVIEYALERRELAKIVLYRSCEPEYARITDCFFEEVVNLVKGSISKGVKLGILKPVDEEVVARVIVGGVKETIKGILNKENVNVDKVVDELIKFCMGGIWNDNGGAGCWFNDS